MQAWCAHAASGRESAGGKTRANRSTVSARERDRPRAEAPRDACALAHAADTRRARRGVTFSESTADGNTATVTDFQCHKVGDPTEVHPKIHPKARAVKLALLSSSQATSVTILRTILARSNFLVRCKCQTYILN